MANENGLKSLDENLRQLEQLVASLNDSNLSIDEAIARYSEGMNLAIECRKSMNEMSRKVTVVRQQAMQAMNQLSEDESTFRAENAQNRAPGQL